MPKRTHLGGNDLVVAFDLRPPKSRGGFSVAGMTWKMATVNNVKPTHKEATADHNAQRGVIVCT